MLKRQILLHIKNKIKILGTTVKFSRDEYQTTEVNLFHNHKILPIDKINMNGNTEIFIQYLIRTSLKNIINKYSDLSELISWALHIWKKIPRTLQILARCGGTHWVKSSKLKFHNKVRLIIFFVYIIFSTFWNHTILSVRK